jgi:eukaryotic-like serine/threonine-protein kinase
MIAGRGLAIQANAVRGESFGHYKLLERLGEGGMAVVYRAITEGPEGFQREVVVKRIRGDLSSDSSFTTMLLAEARLCALLNHPAIVQVYELGRVNGEYFIAMELVEGHDLATLISRARAKLRHAPIGVVCFLILQVAEALGYAHTLRGPEGIPLEIVHRDVSPSNIMVTKLGAVKLVDFGVARATRAAGEDRTRTGTLKGKIGYLSPEQADGLPIDLRSDIFALGIVFHELLTLQRLFRGDDDLQTLRLIREDEVMPPSQIRSEVDADVEKLVMGMLARDPAARVQSCQEVVDRLQPIVHRLSADHGELKRWLDDLAPIPSRHAALDRTTPAHMSGAPTVAEGLPARARALLSPRFLLLFVVGLALAVAGGALVGRWVRHTNAAASAASARARKSVAVLGFRNLSGKPDVGWIATALSEMLTTELGGGESVRSVPAEEVARARVEVGAGDFDHVKPETLERLRTNLGADLTLDGAYLAVSNDATAQLRLDLRLVDAKGATAVALSDTGTQTQLFTLVARVGAQLRSHLGERAVEHGAVAQLPSNPEAARLYAEGLEQLHQFDALSARERLTRAAALEPQNPLIHSSLSAAEDSLGYTTQALAEAKRAYELSRQLAPGERLSIEGRYRLATKDFEQAITAYRSLFALHPDSLEDGLALAHAQIESERPKDALDTCDVLRKLPGAADDPRVDLMEAHASMLASIPERAHKAAQLAIQKGTARGAPLLLARGYLHEGKAQWALAHAKEALAALQTAERTFGAAGDGAGRAATLVVISDLHYAQGNLPEARRTIEDALATSRKLGDKRGEVSALTGLANVIGEEKGGDKASLEIYERVLTICKSTDDKACVAAMLNNEGGVFQGRRDLQNARSHYQQAADLLRQAEVGENTFIVLANLASVLFDLGELPAARTATEDALARCRRSGTKGDTSWTLYYLGRIEAMQGQLDGARNHLQEADRLDEQQGKESERAAARAALAELLLEQHRLPEAETVAKEALVLAKAANATTNLGFGSETQVSEVLARVLLAGGKTRLQEAVKLVTRAREVYPPNCDPDWAMMLATTEARVLAAEGRTKTALAALGRELAHADDYVFHRFWIRTAMAEISAGAHLPTNGKALAREERERGFELLARRVDRLAK